MLKLTFSIFNQNKFHYLIWALASVLISIVSEFYAGFPAQIISGMLTVYLAMFAQGSVIKSVKFASLMKDAVFWKSFSRYFMRSALLGISAFILSLPVTIWLSTFFRDYHTNGFIMAGAANMTICFSVLMALVGTWPTSVLGGGRTPLRAAWTRGSGSFVPTFARLALSLVVTTIPSFVIVTIAMQAYGEQLIPGGLPNISMLSVTTVSQFVQALVITYCAVVLANIYVNSEADAPPSIAVSAAA